MEEFKAAYQRARKARKEREADEDFVVRSAAGAGGQDTTVAQRRGRRAASTKKNYAYDDAYAELDEEDEADEERRDRKGQGRRGGQAADAAVQQADKLEEEAGKVPAIELIIARRWVDPADEARREAEARIRQDKDWETLDKREARRARRRPEAMRIATERLGQRSEAAKREYENKAQQLRVYESMAQQEVQKLQTLHTQQLQQVHAALIQHGRSQAEQQQMLQHQAQVNQQQMQQYTQTLETNLTKLRQELQAMTPPTQVTSDLLAEVEAELSDEEHAREERDREERRKAGGPMSPGRTGGAGAGGAAGAAAGAGGARAASPEVPASELVVPSFVEPHWQYLIKRKKRSLIHCEWVVSDEVEFDNPPYGKQRLGRFLKKLRQDCLERGETMPEGKPEGVEGSQSADLGEYVENPDNLEPERILASKGVDGAPPANSSPEVLERFAWSEALVRIIHHLENHRRGGSRVAPPFMQPVDPEADGVPDYLTIVERPMDLGTVRTNLKAMAYSDVQAAVADIEQVWTNNRTFNSEPDNDVRIMGEAMAAEWARMWNRLTRRVAAAGGRFKNLLPPNVPSSRMFLVKWKSLSYSLCSWEHEDDIDDDKAISDYFARNRVPDKPMPTPRTYPMGAPEQRVYSESPEYGNGRSLRSYQLEGLNWLVHAWRNNRNCILADEMGLGKTAQSICFLKHLWDRENDRGPFLIIAPLSTLGHWQREVNTWLPDLSVCLYHDPVGGRPTRDFIRAYEWHYYTRTPQGQITRLQRRFKFDVLITTYEIAIADVEELAEVPWSFLVVDEGQRLKNRNNKLLHALNRLDLTRRLLLTGTPLQNNVEELWSLLNFIEPGKFVDQDLFLQEFGTLSTAAQVGRLTELMRPHVLRRLKEDVEKSIPKKEETVIDVELTLMQKQYYRALYERNRSFLTRGVDPKAGPAMLNLETELRKCCNHPFLITGVEQRELSTNMHSVMTEQARAAGQQPPPTPQNEEETYALAAAASHATRMDLMVRCSGKMILLDKLLRKLKAEGHKVLVFSQMTRMLDLLEKYVKWRQWPYERIDGSVRGNARQAAIDRFSDLDRDNFVFLLSTRAGGVGITLTAADTVIIFDSDWNPQNDVQAQARAHRIGQTKEVKIYRLVTARTYEATMFQRASRKLGLEQAVMAGGTWSGVGRPRRGGPSKEEIESLLRHGAYGLMDDEEAAAKASKQFEESDIDKLLKEGSRVVNMASGPTRGKEAAAAAAGAGEGGAGDDGTGQSLFNFSKTKFALGRDTGSKVRLDDPEFWSKVLGKDARATLHERLTDGTATASEESKEAFLQELGHAGTELIKLKLNGKVGDQLPPWAEQVMNCLVGVSSMERKFSEDQRARAQQLLDMVERPKRKRKTVLAQMILTGVAEALGGGTGRRTRKRSERGRSYRPGQVASLIGEDDDEEADDDDDESLADPDGEFRPPAGEAGAAKGRKARKGKVSGAEAGKDGGKKRRSRSKGANADGTPRPRGRRVKLDKAVGCTLNIPVCSLKYLTGIRMECCEGPCLRMLSLNTLGVSAEEIERKRRSDKPADTGAPSNTAAAAAVKAEGGSAAAPAGTAGAAPTDPAAAAAGNGAAATPAKKSSKKAPMDPDALWRCDDCEAAVARCFGCGVGGPIGCAWTPWNADRLEDEGTVLLGQRARAAQLLCLGQDGEGEHSRMYETTAESQAASKRRKEAKAAAAAADELAATPTPTPSVDEQSRDSVKADGEEPDSAKKAPKGKAKSPKIPDDPQPHRAAQPAIIVARKIAARKQEEGADSSATPPVDEAGEREAAAQTAAGGPASAQQMLSAASAEEFRRMAETALQTTATMRKAVADGQEPDLVPRAPYLSRPVWLCSHPRCGRFYCSSCITQLARVRFSGSKSDYRKFKCPLHYCGLCGKSGDSMPLAQSVALPFAYHPKCLARDRERQERRRRLAAGEEVKPSTDKDPLPDDVPSAPAVLRLSKQFFIRRGHADIEIPQTCVERNIHSNNNGVRVPGRLGPKEALLGQSGSGPRGKGPLGRTHPVWGDQPRRRRSKAAAGKDDGSSSKRKRKSPAPKGSKAAKGSKGSASPAAAAASPAAAPAAGAKRSRAELPPMTMEPMGEPDSPPVPTHAAVSGQMSGAAGHMQGHMPGPMPGQSGGLPPQMMMQGMAPGMGYMMHLGSYPQQQQQQQQQHHMAQGGAQSMGMYMGGYGSHPAAKRGRPAPAGQPQPGLPILPVMGQQGQQQHQQHQQHQPPQ